MYFHPFWETDTRQNGTSATTTGWTGSALIYPEHVTLMNDPLLIRAVQGVSRKTDDAVPRAVADTNTKSATPSLQYDCTTQRLRTVWPPKGQARPDSTARCGYFRPYPR